MSEGKPLPYFDGGWVFVSSRVAVLWSEVFRTPKVSAVLDRYDSPEETAARAALRKAAKEHKAQVAASQRNYETSEIRIVSASDQEWIDCQTAAELLGVSVRRVQQLAADGMGEMWHGTWRLPLSRVLAHREDRDRRRMNAGFGPDRGRQSGV